VRVLRLRRSLEGGEIARAVPLTAHGNLDHGSGPELRLELAQIVTVWPLGVSLAAAVAARGLAAGRRRTALNEALHELRRPLQALALAVPGARVEEPSAIEWSVQMAATALERLEREINGGAAAGVKAPIVAEALLESAIARWKTRAALAGGSLVLRWRAGEATLEGGPEVAVEARIRFGRLCVSVVDSGGVGRPEVRRAGPAGLIAGLAGRRRHGHGLRVVRRTAAAHGGEFRLHSSERGTEAVLELPLSSEAAAP